MLSTQCMRMGGALVMMGGVLSVSACWSTESTPTLPPEKVEAEPPPGDTRDGAACELGRECLSGYCDEGYCGGSDCAGNIAICEEGWECWHYQPDAFASLFGAEPYDRCRSLCGHCPPSKHCDPAAPEDGICLEGPEPPVIDIGGPYETPPGEPITLTATATSAGTIVSYEWILDDTAEEISGASIEHVFTTTGGHQVEVRVTDSHGAIAYGDTVVNVCFSAGTFCEVDAYCCDGNYCFAGGSCE